MMKIRTGCELRLTALLLLRGRRAADYAQLLLNCLARMSDVACCMDLKDMFIRHADGTYEPLGRITLRDSVGEVTLWPGQRFSPDRKLLGISLREILGATDTSHAETGEGDSGQDQT